MNDGNYAVVEDGESDTVSSGQLHDMASNASGVAVPNLGSEEMASVSVRLVAARQALGLSSGDVAARTRITLRHVEALEEGDYSAMPGRPYAIGFARAYARTVGLPDSEIADAVRAELEGSTPRPELRVVNQFEVGDPAKTPSPLVGWLALGLVGAILGLGGVFWRSYYAPSASLPSLVQKAPQPNGANMRLQGSPRLPPAGAQPTSGPVVFTALEERIWVKFYDGEGKQLMQKQLAKGEAYTVPADAVGPKVWTARPDALAITIGGRPIARLADKEQIMKDVPVDAASLGARLSNALVAPQAQMPVPTSPVR